MDEKGGNSCLRTPTPLPLLVSLQVPFALRSQVQQRGSSLNDRQMALNLHCSLSVFLRPARSVPASVFWALGTLRLGLHSTELT